jgi:uncharacterized RDD family membrane protein YckC
MNKPDYLISTPENVDLHLELAGLGNRILAALIDHLLLATMIILVVSVAVGIGFSVENSPLSSDVKTIIYWYLIGICLLLLFVVNFGYFIFFEGMWQGQTPGKRIAAIRVIEQNGQPVGWSSVWIRNLLRVVDELPGLYIGLLPMMADKNERRFGDFAAGTLVIRERLSALSASGLRIAENASVDIVVDTGQITPDEYNIVVGFLRRRDLMTPVDRQRLAANIARHFKEKLLLQENPDAPELFIEKLFIAYKQRAELEKQ